MFREKSEWWDGRVSAISPDEKRGDENGFLSF